MARNNLALAKKLVMMGNVDADTKAAPAGSSAQAERVKQLCQRLLINQSGVTAYRLVGLLEFQGEIKDSGHMVAHVKQGVDLEYN